MQLRIGVIATLLSILFVSVGWASTVLKMDLPDLVKASDAVAVATVTSVKSFKENGRILTTTTFQTSKTLKGTLDDSFDVTQYGGRVENLTTYVPGMPIFETGERVVVFLERPKGADHFVITGLSQGVFRIAQSPDGESEWVVPSIGDIRLIDPKNKTGQSPVVPSDIHSNNRPLRELIETIETLQSER